PGKVALVGETWQGAVAAAVLMAPPIRAPLLVSSGDGPSPASEQALSALQPKDVLRTAGATAADQAAEIEGLRESLFGGPPKHLVIAAEDDPAFAVPAAAWAARSADPVLYSQTDKLPAATVAVLKDHPRVPVYVLGPTSVISSSVMREIEEISRRVRRVAGRTPATNALALARYSAGSFGWNVNDPGHGFVIARGDAPLNAALAAPLSASGTWGPLLLTESADKLPRAVRQYLLDVKPGYTTDPTRAFYNHAWIVGDESEIDADQQAEINQLAELAKVGGEG
ncbi:MAG TPA: cell wall-binding repeat-containing protein, partial [Solirubrobacterales bacterium]|nr:cell wall-binding repeat-containing protein [Solirubrobacterales bacterium]